MRFFFIVYRRTGNSQMALHTPRTRTCVVDVASTSIACMFISHGEWARNTHDDATIEKFLPELAVCSTWTFLRWSYSTRPLRDFHANRTRPHPPFRPFGTTCHMQIVPPPLLRRLVCAHDGFVTRCGCSCGDIALFVGCWLKFKILLTSAAVSTFFPASH